MYDAVVDTYCYPETTVLRNIPGYRTQEKLDVFEAAMTTSRSEEPLPEGGLDVEHYKAIHHHLFQDVYAWAGEFRTVRIAKDESAFCYPEHIGSQMELLFSELRSGNFFRNISREEFIRRAVQFLAELNAIHPFREGNGRTQTTFFALLAHEAGHAIDLGRLNPEDFLEAMVASFQGGTELLERQVRAMY